MSKINTEIQSAVKTKISNTSQLFTRSDTTQLDTYSSILQSYCIDGDEICDDGLDFDAHTAEVQTFAVQASQFVIGLAQQAGIA
jgi:hypothetical protein